MTAIPEDVHNEDAPQPKKSSFLRESAIIIVSALALSWLIKTFLVQAFYIPSGSMEDTLKVQDRILVSKMVPGVFDVHRGDIVVFKDPGGWLEGQFVQDTAGQAAVRKALTFIGILPQDAGSHLVKRVIGMPGDTVECCTKDGKVTVNGQPIDESLYLKPGVAPSIVEFSQVVPKDSLWVMGDNRIDSGDSRYHIGDPGGGFIPMDNVVGTAFVKMWPFDRAGWLKNPGEVFQDVPNPK
ncbi:signal peptidase I [Timonella sp. A28]|uniref:signal peptidase I n=1 Tax=Timonella sp. A28 TaxID=3442640 RepID=UPI003EBAC636